MNNDENNFHWILFTFTYQNVFYKCYISFTAVTTYKIVTILIPILQMKKQWVR